MDAKLREIITKFEAEHGTLIGVLQDIQEAYGYLPEERLQEVSDELNVPLSRFFSLATFYTTFRLEPIGKHHVCVCAGTACHVRGAQAVIDTFERELNAKAGTTTADGEFTLDTVNCVGACALAPLVVIDGDHHGHMSQKKVPALVKRYNNQEQ